MKWDSSHQSGNVDDLRGRRSSGGRPKATLGVLALGLVLSLAFGRDFLTPLLRGGGGTGGAATSTQPENTPVPTDPAEDQTFRFAGFVLDDCRTTWQRLLSQSGQTYRDVRMAIFRESVDTACGSASSGMGPFYCPGDERVYIDLSFFRELASARFGAQGDFAQAYVIAHEVGHHIQTILGFEDRLRSAQRQNPDRENELSVRFELQADCYAGVWAHSTQQRQLLEAGDIEEAMRAASSVGDDRLQQQGAGTIRPESFTHGTSAQRMQWFRRGLETGQFQVCDTFAANL